MKQQLYIKNEKGRYEPYKEPEWEDNKLYTKLPNGKYEPVGMHVETNMLTEGVWVVTKARSAKGITFSRYLRSCYHLEKVSDLENPLLQLNTAQLGKVNEIMERVYFDAMATSRSPIDNFKVMCADVIYQLTGKKI